MMEKTTQARRASRCIQARSPRGTGPSDPHGLAQVAARIAAELELSPGVIDELLFAPVDERTRTR
jgi:hypothetical protein